MLSACPWRPLGVTKGPRKLTGRASPKVEMFDVVCLLQLLPGASSGKADERERPAPFRPKGPKKRGGKQGQKGKGKAPWVSAWDLRQFCQQQCLREGIACMCHSEVWPARPRGLHLHKAKPGLTILFLRDEGSPRQVFFRWIGHRGVTEPTVFHTSALIDPAHSTSGRLCRANLQRRPVLAKPELLVFGGPRNGVACGRPHNLSFFLAARDSVLAKPELLVFCGPGNGFA